jgi:hypothetical protein
LLIVLHLYRKEVWYYGQYSTRCTTRH